MRKSIDARKHPKPEVVETMTPERPPWWKAWLEYGLVGLVFFLVNGWVQFATPFFADTNDSFYHAKMGEMMADGVLQQFPWLFFTSLHDKFVNHHLLFHLALWPFIQLGNLMHQLNLTDLPGLIYGPKLLITLAITSLFVIAYKMLKQEGIRFPWVWLVFLLCLPYDFFFRMQMIRVQSLSLLVMLGGLLALWNKKFAILGVLSFLYIWLYGGGFFLPIFVFMYVAIQYFSEKELDLRPIYWTVGGAILGFVVNFYFPKNIEFLYQQIFETGLGYQINVGGEWRPYDTWYIFQMSIVVFALQLGSIVLAMAKGLKQNARSITLLAISFFFLVLMFKSKRFVEYWPFFAVLSSAFMLKDYVATFYVNRVRVFNVFAAIISLYLLVLLYTGKSSVPSINWAISNIPKPLIGAVMIFLALCAIIASIYSFLTLSAQKPHISKVFNEVVLGLLLVVLPVYALGSMDAVRRDITRPEDKIYIEKAGDVMACLLDKGQPKRGDIVFTDDWDVFPLFFFYNNLNYYIVGLDPVFMDTWNHELYEEFANITMGKDSIDLHRKISQDFKASFVVADYDHSGLRNNIEGTSGFQKICDNGTFMAYKIVQP